MAVTVEKLATIGVVVHPHRALDRALDTLREWADRCDGTLVQIRMPGQDREVAPAGDAAACDVIAALGGDGTTLAALRAAALVDRPVLGVACGSLGALTATNAEQLDEALVALAAGEWQPRRLPGLAVSGDAGPPAQPDVALNDLVIVRAGASQVAIVIELDGEPYARFAGDGLVVATPLGSSAYTMAAGGPILGPGAEGMVLTPLAAHGGCVPPLVVGSGSQVAIDVEPGHGGARVELDGQIREIESRRLRLAWRSAHATLIQLDTAEPMLAGLRRRNIIMDSPRVMARDTRAAAQTRR